MKVKLFIYITACTILLFSGQASTQSDFTSKKYIINGDTVEVGKFYTIFLPDYETVPGKIRAVNSSGIMVYTDGALRTIDKSEIVAIESWNKELHGMNYSQSRKEKEKSVWSFGVGYIFPVTGSHHSHDDFENGFSAGTNLSVNLNDYIGIRGDMEYLHFPGKNITENFGEYGYYTVFGSSYNTLALKFNLALGNISSKDPVKFCALLGIGGGICFSTEESNSFYSGYTGYSDYSYGGGTSITAGVSAGINVSFRPSDKISLYIEPQVNAWVSEFPNFFIIKSGITLTGK